MVTGVPGKIRSIMPFWRNSRASSLKNNQEGSAKFLKPFLNLLKQEMQISAVAITTRWLRISLQSAKP